MHSFIMLPHISVSAVSYQSRECITTINYTFDKKYTDRDKCVGFVKGVKNISHNMQVNLKIYCVEYCDGLFTPLRIKMY